MNREIAAAVQARLRCILEEMREQTHLSRHFGGESLTFHDAMDQITEYLEEAGEFGIAYESIVASLEQAPFVLTGKAAVSLLEAGLLLGYKSDDPKDTVYDRRNTE
ncbi:MAG: hypothetical protein KDA76_19425 [Planctomycetaceae bacterium]|nr:hypothetical protein [Planctomycetaceae bacterium]